MVMMMEDGDSEQLAFKPIYISYSIHPCCLSCLQQSMSTSVQNLIKRNQIINLTVFCFRFLEKDNIIFAWCLTNTCLNN